MLRGSTAAKPIQVFNMAGNKMEKFPLLEDPSGLYLIMFDTHISETYILIQTFLITHSI